MASARTPKRESLEGPPPDIAPARTKKRKFSAALGAPWTAEEIAVFFESLQQHGPDWGAVAGLVSSRSPEQCEALFSLNKTYLSLPDGIKSVQGLAAMMTDHFNSLEEERAPESSTGTRENVPEPTAAGSLKRSPGHVPRPAKRARTGVPLGRRTPRLPPQAPRSKQEALLRTPPRATRSLAASPSRALRSRDASRSPLKDRQSLRDRMSPGKSPARGPKPAAREGDQKHGNLKQIIKALEAVEERESGKSPPRKKAIAVSKKTRIMARVEAEQSVSSGEEKAGSQAELEDNASSRGEEEQPEKEGRKQPGKGEEKVGGGSEPEEDLPIMKRLEFANPQVEKRPLKKRRGEALGGETLDADSGSEVTRSDDMPIIAGARESKAVTSQRSTPKRASSARKPSSVAFEGPASGLDVLSSVVVAGDALHSPPNASTSASPNPPPQDAQSTGKSRLPPRSPPKNASSTRPRVPATPPRSKSRSKVKPAPQDTPDSSKDDDKPIDINAFLPSKIKDRTPRPKADKTANEAPSGDRADEAEGAHSEDVPLAAPKQRKRKRKPGIEKLPPVPPLLDLKEPSEKKLRPKQRPRPLPSSSPLKGAASSAQPASSADGQGSAPVKAKNKKKPARPSGPARLGALTFPAPPEPRPPAHCPHTEQPEGPSQSTKAKLLHCLNSRVRRWCLYEWFYSALDYPWFVRNEFVEYLEHAGLGGVKRLTRTEWGVIRSSLGHPRRLSSVFLREEREKLASYRELARAAYAEAGKSAELPAELPAPLAVGQRVSARHPRTRQIHEGAILTVDNKGRSRVQFDSRELGTEIIQDIDLMPHDMLRNMPAALKRKRLDMLMEARTIEHTPGELLVLRLEPLMSAANAPTAVALAKQATSEALNEALAAPSTPPSSPRAAVEAEAVREKDIKVLADLQKALDRKAVLLSEMSSMTGELEQRSADAGPSGGPQAKSEAVREQLGKKVRQLEQVNQQVEHCVQQLRQRSRYSDPHSPAWQQIHGSPLQPREPPLEEPQPKPIGEMAAGARRQARAMVAQVVTALQSAGEGEDPMLVLEALGPHLGLDENYRKKAPGGGRGAVSPSGPHAVPGILGTSRAAGKVNWAEAAAQAQSVSASNYGTANRIKAPAVPGDPLTGLEVGGHLGSKDGGRLSELMASCVATLLMIQTCTDRQLPQSDVVLTLDSALASLKPHTQHNQRVWREIEACINTIKGQILTQIPTQQLAVPY